MGKTKNLIFYSLIGRLGSGNWPEKRGSWPRHIPIPLSNVSAPRGLAYPSMALIPKSLQQELSKLVSLTDTKGPIQTPQASFTVRNGSKNIYRRTATQNGVHLKLTMSRYDMTGILDYNKWVPLENFACTVKSNKGHSLLLRKSPINV